MTPDWQSSTPGAMFARLGSQPHLWLFSVDPVTTPLWAAEHLRLLSRDERTRYDRYLRDGDRELFLAAHVFTRKTLSRYANVLPDAWTFDTNEFGRPEITNADSPAGLRFNLAHTSGFVALLVHDAADGGVDVEHRGNVADPVAMSKTVFAPIERHDYLALDPLRQECRFYTLWTLKEAFIKAKGKGLAIGLKDFAFSGLDGPHIQIECTTAVDAAPASWHFTVRQPSPGFIVATAYRPGVGRHGRAPLIFEVSGTDASTG